MLEQFKGLEVLSLELLKESEHETDYYRAGSIYDGKLNSLGLVSRRLQSQGGVSWAFTTRMS
eukprot:234588-Amphidinium_carterae.1